MLNFWYFCRSNKAAWQLLRTGGGLRRCFGIMKKIRRIILSLVLLAGAALAAGAAPAWEEVTTPGQEVVRALDTDQPVESVVRDGYIYIYSQRPVTVKLFSILGQQIHQENVPAGIHRLRINSKGIYILRAGSLTRRVTI